jgi:soluble lytic murein transglycosylase-like protein
VNSIQRAIFPAIIISSLALVGITRLIASPQVTVVAATEPPVVAGEPAAGEDFAAPTDAPVVEQDTPADQGEPASGNGCALPQRYPDSIRQWCDWIERYAAEVGLEPRLVAAVMLQESGGKADAYSHSGAVGLMQVMPRDGLAAEFMCNGRPCFSSRPSMDELFDPEYNISYGTRMLASLVSRHGSVREALRAYGPMDMGYRYADLVLSIYENYQ